MTAGPIPGGPTTVVVDAWALGGAAASRGVGTYVRNVLEGLAQRDDLAVTALALASTGLPTGVGRQTIRRWAPGRWRTAEHWWRLPADLDQADGTVLWSASPEPPRRAALPFVQTVYDVIPLVFPDPGLAGQRRWWALYGRRYRQAETLVAISRHSAQDAIRELQLDPRRVHVVPCGVDPRFGPHGPDGPDGPDGVLAPDAQPYLLVVGEFSTRKGFAEAFAAIGALAELGYPHRLRVAGRIAPWVAPALEALRAGAARPDRIELLGWVEDLPALYRGADAFVGSSRYEGFGFPALEAMACGTPVVAFANSATPEVVGDAGVLVADGNVADLVAGLRGVLDHPDARSAMVALGVAQAALFRWDRAVDAYAEIFAEATRRRG